MADVKPFRAIRYDSADIAPVIAPPYDVLDKAGKDKLLAKSERNIVAIDLPYLPPKTVGPDAVYDNAAATLRKWISEGTLRQDGLPQIYAYSQAFTIRGRTFDRRGMVALVKLEEFSTPAAPTHVVPHEKTYPGPIEDRLKLMRATGVQLSPIFGLFPDEDGSVTGLLHDGLGEPTSTGEMDNVVNKLWAVSDTGVQQKVVAAMKSRKVYIADGHHRYTTALAYKKELEKQTGGPLPADHPANYCLFVLVSMHDAGCVILPTHRIVGGLKNFDIGTLKTKLAGTFAIDEVDGDETAMASFEDGLAADPITAFGLFDGSTRKLYLLRLTNPDVLKQYEPNQSPAWRALDVAILRRYLLDEIIGPTFATGGEPTLAYTADPTQVPVLTDGTNYQIALVLRPTPLEALRQLGEVGEVMPQKSTYFYPKLATGIAINPLR
jgi:uncharacterized protein (DUF1015 family)